MVTSVFEAASAKMLPKEVIWNSQRAKSLRRRCIVVAVDVDVVVVVDVGCKSFLLKKRAIRRHSFSFFLQYFLCHSVAIDFAAKMLK